LLTDFADAIIRQAENSGGFYDGSKDVLPWTFSLQELADPRSDVGRLIRIWNGDYFEVRSYGWGAHERHLYLFRDGQGIGLLAISENMAFQYFEWFFILEQAQSRLVEEGEPTSISRGLPSAGEIEEMGIPEDYFPELFSHLRTIGCDYLSGTSYEESVRDLVLFLSDIARK
jgi:hypothetical protein